MLFGSCENKNFNASTSGPPGIKTTNDEIFIFRFKFFVVFWRIDFVSVVGGVVDVDGDVVAS